MSLADSSVSSASDAESEKRKSRPRTVPNVADDHNKSTADANTNTNSNSQRIPRIPESFRNMTKNLPSHWERIRSLVTHLCSEMNCLGEENVNVTLEETVNFFYLDRDEEGKTTTFEDTLEGNTAFDEVTTLTYDDDTLFSNFIDVRINTSIEHVPRKNSYNNHHNKGYTGTDFMFDVDDQEDVDGHPHIHSIFDGNSTVDDTTYVSSLWKASTIAYEAASDDLDNDNDNNHVDVDSHRHEHPHGTDWDNNEEENNNNILPTRSRKDHNTRSPSSPLMKPVSLELELGLNRDDGTTDDTGILRSFIVIPTTRTSAKQNNRSVEEDDDDGTRDFPFDNDDAVSLLTTDIALMTSVYPSLSPSKKTLLRSSSPSSKLLARPPSFFFNNNNNNNNNHKMRSRSTAAVPSSSHSLSRSRSKAAAAASSVATTTSSSSSTKKNKFWKRFLV